jgi:hypothetical protein
MIRLWLGRAPSLAFKLGVVLVSLAATAILAFLPDIAKSYQAIPVWVFGVVLILVILFPFADHVREQNQFWARVFRFSRATQLITGTIKDEHGEDNMPPYDKEAVDLLSSIMNRIGIRTHAYHCKEDLAWKTHQQNMVLICGPIRNERSAEVNLTLEQNTPWFSGFYLKKIESTNAPERQHQEEQWTISHSTIEGFSAPFHGLPAQGAQEDYGLIYIGPNPCNLRRWLIWVAGLGPIGTYGACVAFEDMDFVRMLATRLSHHKNYISACVRYRYRKNRPREGNIVTIITCDGIVSSNA